ncbi:MAG TPA: VWA domain-containing protein [Kiritimatiellia bacterium]|nr:VWA domain-containing protein [Kiritimatiellia bacterium]HMP34899.1 VWA domain-containing protein [Kiritimatiellia bacterium]
MTAAKSRQQGWSGLRPHVAAMIALLLSAGLHATLLSRVDQLTILRLPNTVDQPRYSPMELVEVRMQPPPETVKLEPASPETTDAGLPPAGVPDAEAVAALRPPEPVRLPLPEAPPIPVVSAPAQPDGRIDPVIRQDVMAIQDRVVPDDEAALPRRWVEADIPRIDQAPDIQLPVAATPVVEQARGFTPASAAVFIEDMEAGTPDWSAVMAQRGVTDSGGQPIRPVQGRTGGTGTLDERPEEVSSLTAIENLLQIRVDSFTEPDGSYLYVAVHIEPARDGILSIQPRDILFIQDSSESMTPWKLDECRRGLKRWLDFLNPGDRFEVMGFRNETYSCFGQWTAYDAASREQAVRFIDGMRAVGDTDVYRSLETALTMPIEPGRTPLLILVTDGRPTVGVIGSTDIIEGITRYNRGRVSMFSVGGGKKVNSFFLDLISYRNRGEAVVAKGEEEIPAAMEAWARQLRRPVLTDLSYVFSRVDTTDIYPKQLTHLFLDRPLTIHGRFAGDTDRITFQVVGRSGGSWHDMVFDLDRSQMNPAGTAVRQQWAWQKAYHMIGDYLGDPTEARMASIHEFVARYGLLVPYGFSRAMPRTGSR